MIKYMSLTRTYFYNDQQILLAINQIYNHALKSEYSIDKGNECPISRADGQYPSYWKIDLFCYAPQGSPDLQTFKNSTQNTEFVKFTNILNQFILTFSFPLSYKINNYIQINLDNQEEMVSVYPQGTALTGYSPRQRPFFTFQKQQYNENINKTFYVSQYFKWYSIQGGTLYGQTLTVSLLNGTQFQGVVLITVQFSVFETILQNFPDVNLALIAIDGTVLFEQTQLQTYNQQQYIFNQSSTGYNYLDWINISTNQDYVNQIKVNNTLFPEPITVNIKKFNDLPYYFIVYNNLTYENQVKDIQMRILQSIQDEYHTTIIAFVSCVIILVIGCYIGIEILTKPVMIIQSLISCHHRTFKDFKKIRQLEQSNNILDLLLLVIYFKHNELQNLSFHKSTQCQQIEDLNFPDKLYIQSEIRLIQYLQERLENLEDKEREIIKRGYFFSFS